MSMLLSIFRVISSLDGECLVLQAGEKPCVFTGGGQVRLSTNGLDGTAVLRIIERLLPANAWRTLEERGTVQHEFSVTESPTERFSVVAARSGQDVWAEIRRRSE